MAFDDDNNINSEEPVITGSSGTQAPKSVELVVMDREHEKLSQLLSNHGEGGLRGTSVKLIELSARQMERAAESFSTEIEALQGALSEARDKQTTAEIRTAVLEERIACGFQIAMPANILLTLGGITAGCGIQSWMTATTATAVLLTLGGAILIGASWVHNYKSSTRK